MIAKHALDLTAEFLSEPDDFWFFRDDCHSFTAKDRVDVVTNLSEEPFGCPSSGHGNMDVVAFEHIEDRATDDFAVLFYAKAG